MITGDVKTTPVAALQRYTRNIPIVEEIKKQSANRFVTIKAPEDQTWIETKPKIKLSTQNDPVNVIINLLENLGIPAQVKKRAKLESPFDYIKCDINLDLLDATNKKTYSVDFLKPLALETLNTKYPSEEWLRVYTDGSLTVEGEGVGAGVYSELFSHYSAVGKNKTVFEGECQAILYALTQLLYHQKTFEKVWTPNQ
jgi:hypothetical protein